MGNLFPGFLVFLLIMNLSHLFANNIILLPSDPVRISPAENNSQNVWKQNLRRKKILRKKRQKKQKELEKNRKKQVKELERSKKGQNAPLVFLGELHMVFPSLVSKSQSDFQSVGPNFHLHTMYRQEKQASFTYNRWFGFRLSSFSGYANDYSMGTRFTEFYWGPSISFGRISRTKVKKQKHRAESYVSSLSRKQRIIQNAWFYKTGLAAKNRFYARYRSSSNKVFRSNKIDGPALWFEISYLKLYQKLLGSEYSVGLLLEKGQSFAWFSVSITTIY